MSQRNLTRGLLSVLVNFNATRKSIDRAGKMGLNICNFGRVYKNLPEVRKKREEERRAEFYKTNRLRAQLYGKVFRDQLL